MKTRSKLMMITALLVFAALIGCTLASAHVYVPQYQDKYVNPSDSDTPVGTGDVYVTTRCMNNLMDSPIIIYRVDTNLTFTNEHTISASDAVKLITDLNDNETMDFSIDGHQDYPLAAGQFVFELVNGDRGNPEYAIVNVVQGNTYHITFLGHAASIVGTPVSVSVKPTGKIEIILALYAPDMTMGSGNPTGFGIELNSANHFGIKDVTGIVQSLVNSGQTSFVVSNANLGGDPAYGWYKALSITYTDGTTTTIKHGVKTITIPVVKTVYVREGATITL